MRINRTLRDFVRYVCDYRKLKYYMDTKYICLGDILHRSTPELDRPGQIETWCMKNCIGRFEQINDQLWAFDIEPIKLVWYKTEAHRR